MTVVLKANEIREMLNEAARFSADLHIIEKIEEAEKESIEKGSILKEEIVRKATIWAPRKFQPTQLDTLYELAKKSMYLRLKENIEDFTNKFGIEIEGVDLY